MIGHIFGGFNMMRLGGFTFGLSTAAYQELQRQVEYKWASLERFGQMDAKQYTGPGDDSITLNGVVFPEFRGGTGQLDRLRALGASGQPQTLVSGSGKVMGRWIIETVTEGQSIFASGGVPRRQEFTVAVKKFDDGLIAELVKDAAPKDAAAAAGTLETAKSSATQFVDKVVATASQAAATVSSAIEQVQAKVQEIGAAAAPLIATAQRTIGAVQQMRSAAMIVKQSISGVQSVADIPGVLSGVMSATSQASNAAATLYSQAGDVAQGLPQAVSTAKDAVTSLAMSASSTAVACGKLYGEAERIVRGK